MERSAFSRGVKAALLTLLALAPPFCIAWLMYAVWWDGVLPIKGVGHAFHFLNPYHSFIATSGWVIFAGLLAAFPLWLRDVSRMINAHSVLPFSPMRAALAFFVPFQQILLPYSISRSLCFRLDRKVGRDPLLLAWTASWLLMLPAGIAYAVADLPGVHFSSYSHLILWVYGSAAMFCSLALLLVLRIENGLKNMGNLGDNANPAPALSALFASAETIDEGVTIDYPFSESIQLQHFSTARSSDFGLNP